MCGLGIAEHIDPIFALTFFSISPVQYRFGSYCSPYHPWHHLCGLMPGPQLQNLEHQWAWGSPVHLSCPSQMDNKHTLTVSISLQVEICILLILQMRVYWNGHVQYKNTIISFYKIYINVIGKPGNLYTILAAAVANLFPSSLRKRPGHIWNLCKRASFIIIHYGNPMWAPLDSHDTRPILKSLISPEGNATNNIQVDRCRHTCSMLKG